jgi:hypothetical protein
MAVPSSLTVNYDAVLSTTMFNMQGPLQDEISTSNALLFKIMGNANAWKGESDLGDRWGVPLMYELGSADSYSGYDILDTTPMDGITTAFFDWRQFSAQVAISGIEEKKNSGSETKILSLLESKIKQATMGIQDKFGRALLHGNGINVAAQITTAYTSPNNASVFIDPLPSLVRYDPTTSTVIGNINQSTNVWWRNQTKNFTGVSTYAGFLKGLRNLYNNCSKGPGGSPDLHVLEQQTYELYESALAAAHQNPSYQSADIPFENIAFKGKPCVWDEFVPDVGTGSTTITKGTWFMLNTKFWGGRYHPATNFAAGPFIKPENQDAKVSQILWLGSFGVSNRRKQGVGGNIDLTIAA